MNVIYCALITDAIFFLLAFISNSLSKAAPTANSNTRFECHVNEMEIEKCEIAQEIKLQREKREKKEGKISSIG